MLTDSYEFAVALIDYIKDRRDAMPATALSVTVATARSSPYYTVEVTSASRLGEAWPACLVQFASGGSAGLSTRLVKSTDAATKTIRIHRKPRTGAPSAGNTASLTAGPLKTATFSLASLTASTMSSAFAQTTPCHIHVRCIEDNLGLKTLSPQREKLAGSLVISRFEVWIYMSKEDTHAAYSLRTLPALTDQIVELIAQFLTTVPENSDATLVQSGVGVPTFTIRTKTGSDPTAANRPILANQIEFYVKFS